MGRILSPAMPAALFPCWPQQTRAEQLRAPSTGALPRTPRAAPGSCHLLEPLFASGPPPMPEKPMTPTCIPPKNPCYSPNDGKSRGSQPSFPHVCSSQGLSTPKVELGQPSSRGMKGKKGFLSPSEESPPRCQPQQSSHRPQRPRAAHSAPPRSDVCPRGMDLPAIPCIRRRLHAGRAARLKEQGPSKSPDTPSSIYCGTTPATSGKKEILQSWAWPGMPRTTRRAPVPTGNEPWLIYTRVPHLSCPPQGLLQALGGCSLPNWSQVTQTR